MKAADSKPTTWGRYEVLESLEREPGFELYRAKSLGVEGFEKTVLLKRLDPSLVEDPELNQGFLKAARLAMRLSHANVVQVFDLAKADDPQGGYFMAMEYVVGLSLDEVLALTRAREHELPLELCLYVAAELAKALDHAHRRRDERLRPLRIAHADLKPTQIRVSWEGEVKLSGFCVSQPAYELLLRDPTRARAAGLDDSTLRIEYASPELVEHGRAEPPGDLFALAAVLYEMLGGRAPFTPALRRAGVRDFVPLSELRPGLPEELAELVHRGLAFEAEGRPESAADVYERLRALQYAAAPRFGAGELAAFLDRAKDNALGVTASSMLLSSYLPPPEVTPILVERRSSRPVPLEVGVPDRSDVAVLTLTLPAGSKEQARAEFVVERYAGRLIPGERGRLCAAFGLDVSEPRQVENAVRCALVLGRGLHDHGSAIGVDVDRLRVPPGAVELPNGLRELLRQAALLEGVSPRGVVVSSRAAKSLSPSFEMQRLGTDADAPWLVEDVRPPQQAFGRLLGRKRELELLADWVVQASKKRLRVGGIVGPHGIGKTRLLYEVKRRIDRNPHSIGCYVAACHPQGREYPYSAMGNLLRVLCGVREGDPEERLTAVEPRLRALGLRQEEVHAVLSELGSSARTEAERGEVLNLAIGRMIGSLAADRMHLFAWDNAQEMDRESAELLRDLAEQLQGRRVLFLLAARDGSGAVWREIPGYEEIQLGELDEDDTLRLIADRLGTKQVSDDVQKFVYARTQGHPMLTEELLHEARLSGVITLSDDGRAELHQEGALAMPRSLRTLVSERLRRLPAPERELLAACAVLGRSAELPIVAAMLRSNVARINETVAVLEAEKLLRHEGALAVAFPTDLLPELLLEHLPPDARAQLHRRAAEAYAELPLGQTSRDLVGDHLLAAGDHDAAATCFAAGGLEHAEARRYHRAVRDLKRALDHAELAHRPHPQLAVWISVLALSLRHAPGDAQLEAVARRLCHHFESSSQAPDRLETSVLVDLGRILGSLHCYQDAHALLRRAIETGHADRRHGAIAARLEIALEQGDFKLALTMTEALLFAHASELGEQHRGLLHAAHALAFNGEHERASFMLERAEQLAGADEPTLECERSCMRAILFGLRREWEACRAAGSRAAEEARSAGLAQPLAVSLNVTGDACLHLSDHARAYAAFGASLAAAEQAGLERLANRNRISLSYLDARNGAAGAHEELRRTLARAADRNWTRDELLARSLIADLLERSRNVEAARRELELALALAESTANQVAVVECRERLSALKSVRPTAEPWPRA